MTDPIVICGFEGWNDAGDAASSAIEHLQLIWDAEPLGELDPDPYYDFQVTRPTVKLVDGITRQVTWPTTRLSVCRPPGCAHDVVLVHGIEPNMRWRAFSAELVEQIERIGARTVVTLGALLADAPHTRPVPVTGAAYDADSAARYGLERSRYEGPTGIVGINVVYMERLGLRRPRAVGVTLLNQAGTGAVAFVVAVVGVFTV
ncbi:PAC2 family protein, partial [Saccharopolyspora sp. WRP15-2]|nr:PAC2 family protein [Saccharopolyspora oryzae]